MDVASIMSTLMTEELPGKWNASKREMCELCLEDDLK